MPKEKNRALRLIVPILAAAGAIGVAVVVFRGRPSLSAPTTQPTQTGQAPNPSATPPLDHVAASNGSQPAAGEAPAASPSGAASQAAPEKAAGESPAARTPTGLHARVFSAATAPFAPIGGVEPKGQYLAQIEFSPFGAGVEAITLARYFDTVQKKNHYRVQEPQTYTEDDRSVTVASLAARGVEIDGQFVNIFSDDAGSDHPVWREIGPGEFEAFIDDAQGNAVARLLRHFTIGADSYDITLDQRVFNLTDRALSVKWYQYGPVDLEQGDVAYGGDKRRIRFGYLLPPGQDASRQIVEADSKLHGRADYTGRIAKSASPSVLAWADPSLPKGSELVWAAMTNRYFAFAVHPLLDAAAIAANSPLDKRLREADEVYAVLLAQANSSVLILQLNSAPMHVEAGQALDLSMGAYAGPLWKQTLAAEPELRAVRLDELVVYNLGGPCSFCTFQWLAQGLFWFLGVLHDYLVHDWALAIMILVVCVRTVLHPITRKSQISLQRFSKQMASLAPKQAKLREKYGADPKKLQAEMMKLYREENVKFTGALGCLPMFLQSPVWIALYAMLYFAFDLRHEPAFFGLFQALSGGKWTFLGDLSAPDHFIAFGRTIVTLPLLGPINAINILPLVLGVVFFVQQKYLTPPPTTAMTAEQETQQKIMKVMMVVMFPLMMYNAPSGLALYFITNSVLGIMESRYIRAHITKMDLEPPKPTFKHDSPSRKNVANTASTLGKRREREGSAYKPRDPKKK